MSTKILKKAGCNMSYANVNDGYTLKPTTGGNKCKQNSKGGSKLYSSVNDSYTLNPNIAAKGGNGLVLPPAIDNLGSVFNNMVSAKGGNKNKGGLVVELSPILTSLILLGARAAIDNGVNPKMKKELGSALLSSSKRTSKSSKSSKPLKTPSKY
jgi:hypothetical protein